MIPALRFFEQYVAVGLHLSGGAYDYFKYQGKMKITQDTLTKRKDKWFFEKCAKKVNNEEDALGFIVSNYIADKKYIRNFDEDVYTKWMAYRDALDHNFGEELEKYLTLKKETGIVDLCYSGQISREFVILLNHMLDGYLFSQLDKDDNFVWKELKKKLLPYSAFIINMWNIDTAKLRKIAKEYS